MSSSPTRSSSRASTADGGTIVAGQGLGTISNDDAVGDVSITDVSAEDDSGTTRATFTVSRTGRAAFAVDYATADGTATAGLDYVVSSGTLSFAKGQASQTVLVTRSLSATRSAPEPMFRDAEALGGARRELCAGASHLAAKAGFQSAPMREGRPG